MLPIGRILHEPRFLDLPEFSVILILAADRRKRGMSTVCNIKDLVVMLTMSVSVWVMRTLNICVWFLQFNRSYQDIDFMKSPFRCRVEFARLRVEDGPRKDLPIWGQLAVFTLSGMGDETICTRAIEGKY